MMTFAKNKDYLLSSRHLIRSSFETLIIYELPCTTDLNKTDCETELFLKKDENEVYVKVKKIANTCVEIKTNAMCVPSIVSYK